MIFDPESHIALDAIAWDENAVREAIVGIVRCAGSAFVPGSHWAKRPIDTGGMGIR